MTRESARFSLTVKAYSGDLYRYAYWLCHNAHQAEDLVQETLLRAWKHWNTIEDTHAIKHWLFTILRREFLRNLSKSERMVFENWDEAALHNIPDIQSPPEDELALRAMLLKIPLSMREPLVLQVIGGFSNEEISGMLTISVGAVQTRLTRARQWLKNWVTAEQKKGVRDGSR